MEGFRATTFKNFFSPWLMSHPSVRLCCNPFTLLHLTFPPICLQPWTRICPASTYTPLFDIYWPSKHTQHECNNWLQSNLLMDAWRALFVLLFQKPSLFLSFNLQLMFQCQLHPLKEIVQYLSPTHPKGMHPAYHSVASCMHSWCIMYVWHGERSLQE